jgi:hypothetical protein
MANLHNSYYLMKIAEKVQYSCLYFKRLIKNYSEALIDTLAEINNVNYNYQIGRFAFRRGEVSFDRNSHCFTVRDNGRMIPGEPLTLNFSNKNYAIVGLHVRDGRGITFDNKFYDRIFQWMASCE